MKIVVTGGGSGGHITPILAVAAELKKLQPKCQIDYIGQRGDHLADIPKQDPHIDAVYTVRAGKFRRYHGEGLKQALDVPTQFKNVRDLLYTTVGLGQSIRLLRRLRPDVVFTRGGFVSVPVGLAAALLHIPYITHDSDGTPSLANRIIAKWAVLHAVALPKELYVYPQAKTVTVGVPVSGHYKPVTQEAQAAFRQELNVPITAKLLLVTGGGNGAHKLNQAVIESAPQLFKRNPELILVHIAGRTLQAGVQAAYEASLPTELQAKVRVKGFVTDLYRYSGAADVIVARGGATNLAEFALQAKACLIVPHPGLAWALHDSELLAKAGAVALLNEDQLEQEQRLSAVLTDLLEHETTRHALSRTLATYARPDAAKQLAMILLDTAK
jgi:UDP-N-acetylglucosamine--N-acetylmuramyl-(pentapeptide) pyrophosphoryl-undecaprenol N-acetylglucosamine transferase